jgi:tetratricopeptide (TPR) repeat protein
MLSDVCKASVFGVAAWIAGIGAAAAFPTTAQYHDIRPCFDKHYSASARIVTCKHAISAGLRAEYLTAGYYALGIAYADAAQYDDAVTAYSSAIEQNKDNWAAYIGRAVAYHSLGKADLANNDLDTAVSLDPKRASAIYLAGVKRRDWGDADAGNRQIAAAIAIDPTVATDVDAVHDGHMPLTP